MSNLVEAVTSSSSGKGKGKVAKAKAQSKVTHAAAQQNSYVVREHVPASNSSAAQEVVGVQALTNAAAYVLGGDVGHANYDDDHSSDSGISEGDSEFDGEEHGFALGLSDILGGSATSNNMMNDPTSQRKTVPRSGKMVFRRSVTMLTRKLVRELSESYRRCFPKPDEMDDETYESRMTLTLLKKVIPAKLEEMNKVTENPVKVEEMKRMSNAQRQKAFRERRRALKEKEKMMEQKGKVQELQTVVEKQQTEIGKGKAICEQIQFYSNKRKRGVDPSLEEEEHAEADTGRVLVREHDEVESGAVATVGTTGEQVVPAIVSFSSSSALIQSLPFISTVNDIRLADEDDDDDDDDDFSMSSIDNDDDPSSVSVSSSQQQQQQQRLHPQELHSSSNKVARKHKERRASGSKFDPMECATSYVETKYAGENEGKALVRQSKNDFYRTVINGIYSGVGKLVVHRKELREKVNACTNTHERRLQYGEEQAYLQTLKDRYWLQKRVKEDLLDFAEILDLSFSLNRPVTSSDLLSSTSRNVNAQSRQLDSHSNDG